MVASLILALFTSIGKRRAGRQQEAAGHDLSDELQNSCVAADRVREIVRDLKITRSRWMFRNLVRTQYRNRSVQPSLSRFPNLSLCRCPLALRVSWSPDRFQERELESCLRSDRFGSSQ